ncbi:MAG: hypothetical protein J6Y30_09820 [Treponema sp.]|nr:hypothetical protein [Treponema sp.]
MDSDIYILSAKKSQYENKEFFKKKYKKIRKKKSPKCKKSATIYADILREKISKFWCCASVFGKTMPLSGLCKTGSLS